MSEEESAMKTETPGPAKEASGTIGSGNENFVVLDMAGESEDSDKEGGKDGKEKPPKTPPHSDSSGTSKPHTSEADAAKPSSITPRMRKKPKAPVVDVNSLRKRKWQLKVYPLHADDLRLNYVSILCKLASESLLYIPSEGRHGKAELYVATQKETAAIIGKLLRMGFHHPLLSIEVVRKDTGGKEDGEDSKKECKAFLMFDKYLSKKIFDAKGEKGTLIEKTVTLNKVPKAATKDFIGALFPFATEIDIIESDEPEERKATVKCKTPVTSLLVYKSFKRLEINDVHVKLSVDDSVKAIRLPHAFFVPPPEKKDNGPPEQSEDNLKMGGGGLLPLPPPSLASKRPLALTTLNRRAQLIKKRAMLNWKKPTRAQVLRAKRLGTSVEEVMEESVGPMRQAPPGGGPSRSSMPRRGMGSGGDGIKSRLAGRDMGPGRRRMMERQGDRRRDRDSVERGRRRSTREESQMTKEMLQLQNQLNQAIKNQIAMLSTAQGSGAGPAPLRGSMSLQESFGLSGSSSAHRSSLLGQGPSGRHFGSGAAGAGEPGLGPSGSRAMDSSDYPSWGMERSGRQERGERDMPHRDITRPDHRDISRPDHRNRSERGDRVDRPGRMGSRDRVERGSRDRGAGDRSERSGASGDLGRQTGRSAQRQSSSSTPYPGASTEGRSRPGKGERNHSGATNLGNSHGVDSGRGGSSRTGRGAADYGGTGGRSSQRNESSYTSQGASSSRYSDYASQSQGENGSYYRRY